MPAFRFRLEKVLDWYRAQCDAEEIKLRQCNLALARARAAEMQMKTTRTAVELEVRALTSLRGRDLAALAAYRLRMEKQERQLAGECQSCQQRQEEQWRRWTLAHRRVRLFEKLKARRLLEFESERDRQVETLATELYLAQWQDQCDRRQEGPPRNAGQDSR